MFNIEFEAEDGGKQFAWQVSCFFILSLSLPLVLMPNLEREGDRSERKREKKETKKKETVSKKETKKSHRKKKPEISKKKNSWGLSTRSIGVMVMVHGDDKGLVMPPLVSPVQLVAIPIVNAKMSAEDLEALNSKAGELVSILKNAGVRCELDARSDKTPGWKYNHWEVKGVPLRLELGPRDMESRVAVVARRDGGAFIGNGGEGGSGSGESSTSSGPAKETVSWDDLATKIPALLAQVQADMYARAKARFDSCLEKHETWEGFQGALER